MGKKVLGQESFTAEYIGTTEIVRVEFVMKLEQRQFYKWLRLSCTFDAPNDEFDEWKQPLLPGIYPKEQKALFREIDRYIKNRLLDKGAKPPKIWRETEIEE